MTQGIKTSMVRIRDVDGGVVGAGFLVGDRLVLTCAHVINSALGRGSQAVDRPGGAVMVDFPLLAAPVAAQPAAVVGWLPVAGEGEGDIALLQLADAPPPGATLATLVQADEPWGHRFRVCGFPAGYDGGDWASGRLLEAQASHWLQVEDDKITGHWVQPGYSGAPVWDEQLAGIVGMAVAADRHPQARVAYVLPTAVLVQACPELAEQSSLPCPYRGLAAFHEQDADVFFGREAFTARLVEAVQRRSLVALVGASGSGKSSVLFAGLLPTLGRQGDRMVVVFRPGTDPVQALAAALLPALDPTLSRADLLVETPKMAAVLRQGRLGEVVDQVIAAQQGRPLLLVGDQLEELFTLCPDPAQQRSFLDGLLSVTATVAFGRRWPVGVVLALRADFYGQALQHRGLADALQDATVLLGPMTRDELRRAVEEPARRRRVSFEAGLVDRILDEVEHQPGRLPLLEFTLTLLWDKQTGRRLTHRGYDELGGIEGALAGYADRVLDDLDETERERARRVFVQLVKPGETTDDTRRLASRIDLGPADWALLQRLADDRLVVTDRDPAGREIAEVVHEALIRAWPRLRTWMAADRDFRVWQERLRSAVQVWQASNRDSGALLRGAPLVEAERWLGQRPGDLSPTEQEFIAASRSLEVKELEAERRTSRRLRRLIIGLSLSLLVAVSGVIGVGLAAGVASRESAHARQEAAIAVSRQLAAQALSNLASHPALSLLLSLQALRTTDTAEARSALLTALQRSGRTPGTQLDGRSNSIRALAFSPDGRGFITGHVDGRVVLWDTTTRSKRDFAGAGSSAVTSVALSPDGVTAASGAEDGKMRLWDVSTGRLLRENVGHTGPVTAVAFSPDAQTVISASTDDTIRLWDRSTGRPRGGPLAGHVNTVTAVAISPDGRVLASASDDHTVRLWDLADLTRPGLLGPPFAAQTQVSNLVFSPDGTTLAWAGQDGTATLVVLSTLAHQELTYIQHPRPGRPLIVSDKPITSIAVSPDGRTLAVGTADGSVIFWDFSSRWRVGEPLRSHTGAVSVAFSPDARMVASGGEEGKIMLWNVNVDVWKEAACKAAERNMSRAEWDQFVGPEKEYRRLC